jgi:hypothetical protein
MTGPEGYRHDDGDDNTSKELSLAPEIKGSKQKCSRIMLGHAS